MRDLQPLLSILFLLLALTDGYSQSQRSDMLFAEGSPAGVKAALSLAGRMQNVLRLPLVTVSEELTERLSATLRQGTTMSGGTD